MTLCTVTTTGPGPGPQNEPTSNKVGDVNKAVSTKPMRHARPMVIVELRPVQGPVQLAARI